MYLPFNIPFIKEEYENDKKKQINFTPFRSICIMKSYQQQYITHDYFQKLLTTIEHRIINSILLLPHDTANKSIKFQRCFNMWKNQLQTDRLAIDHKVHMQVF